MRSRYHQHKLDEAEAKSFFVLQANAADVEARRGDLQHRQQLIRSKVASRETELLEYRNLQVGAHVPPVFPRFRPRGFPRCARLHLNRARGVQPYVLRVDGLDSHGRWCLSASQCTYWLTLPLSASSGGGLRGQAHQGGDASRGEASHAGQHDGATRGAGQGGAALHVRHRHHAL